MTRSPLCGRPLTFGSLFTGAGGADLGLERAGMVPLWGCEVDKKCQDVLRFNRPQVPVYPDVRTFPVQAVPVPDVLWMSPPCQDLSVAGKRAGLSGERSGLFYEATRIAAGLRDRGLKWVLMEQVPGLFSSDGGADVREVLGELSDLGVSVGWRVLDSQWFGVPQRRRRAFFVVDLGGKRVGEVLALAQGLRGDTPPSREAGKVSATLFASGAGASRPAGCASELDFLIPFDTTQITSAGNYSSPKPGDPCHPLAAGAHAPAVTFAIQERAVSQNPNAGPMGAGFREEVAYTLEARHHVQSVACIGLDADYNGNPELVNAMKSNGQGAIRNGAVAFAQNQRGELREMDVSSQVTCGGGKPGEGYPAVRAGMAVRRLTPRECERLQGWNDDHTRWGTREDGTTYELADGPRYKMAGNGVTASVAAWIGRNLIEAENGVAPFKENER